jgi:N-acetylmuramoyl-L-alanine amidase
MIGRIWIYLTFALALTIPGQNDGAHAADFDFSNSEITLDWRGHAQVSLRLTQAMPFQVHTKDNPPRIIVNFHKDMKISSPKTPTALEAPAGYELSAQTAAVGTPYVIAKTPDLMVPDQVEMRPNPHLGGFDLRFVLRPVAKSEFIRWLPQTSDDTPKTTDQPFTIVIDPGHGGHDPGAIHGSLVEKQIMLRFAKALAREFDQHQTDRPMRVVLTRTNDSFVPLMERLAIARGVGADVFLSFHADAAPGGTAEGLTVYHFSANPGASGAADHHDTAQLAARLGMAELRPPSEGLGRLLEDMARAETQPRTQALARTLIQDLGRSGARLNSSPLRGADFMVLRAAEIPSILLELGFANNSNDAKNLQDPAWRERSAAAIVTAVMRWRDDDQALRSLAPNVLE